MGPWPWDSTTTSLAGLVGACILSIITGLLIPRWAHIQQVKFWKQRYEDINEALENERKRNDTFQATLGKLLTYAEAGDRILHALPTPQQHREEVS